jgi:hypothetical protein
MIPTNNISYYGDETRWFVGEVVNVSGDQLKIGRVRVRIHGIHDDENIKDDDLPWAQIVVPVTQGVNGPVGQYLGMLVGTQVFGVFLDGKSAQMPLVVGSIPRVGDINERVYKNGTYPHNKVYETEQGHFKEYDDTPGDARIREQHKSGTYYEMQEDGNLKIVVTKDCEITVAENCTLTVKGTADISAEKGVNIRSAAGVSLNSSKF